MFRRSYFFIWRVPPCGASYFARGGKVGKPPPGDGSDKRLRGAGAYSHLVPTPSGPSGHLPLTGGVGPRSPCYGSGSLRRRKVRFIPDAQVWASVMPLPCSSSPHRTRFAGLRRGPQLGFSNAHRLVPAYLFGAVVFGQMHEKLPSCHGYARVGGVCTTQMLPNFHFVGACAPEARRTSLS